MLGYFNRIRVQSVEKYLPGQAFIRPKIYK